MDVLSDLARAGTSKSAFEDLTGGGGDVVTKLATDFSNATVSAVTITDGASGVFSFTPGANVDFEVEAWLLLATPTSTILPRVQVSIGAGMQYGAISIEQCGATVTTEAVLHGNFGTTAASIIMAAGGLPGSNFPFEAVVRIKGRSGATPGAIALQMAAETAGTACLVKAGSRMTRRTV